MASREWADEGFSFVAGDVRGVRAFKVDRYGWLTGVVQQKVWTPGENVARCLRTAPKGTKALQEAIAAAGDPAQQQKCPCGCGTALNVVQALIMATGGSVGSGYSYSFSARAQEFEPLPCSGLEPGCTCGFYAYQKGSNDYYLGRGSMYRGEVGAVIRGYGKVVLCTRGFRAEKAEILALSLDAAKGELQRMQVTCRYPDIPVFSSYEQMLEKFPPSLPEPDDQAA